MIPSLLIIHPISPMDMPSPYYASQQKSPVLPGLSLFILFLVLQCKVLIQIAFQHTVIQLTLFIGRSPAQNPLPRI